MVANTTDVTSVTKQIVVLDDDGEHEPETKTELELYYERLSYSHPHVPKYVWSCMHDMDVNPKWSMVSSNIPTITIRNIMDYVVLILRNRKSTAYSIPMQFNQAMPAIDSKTGVKMQVAPHTKVNITGYVFDVRRSNSIQTALGYYHKTISKRENMLRGTGHTDPRTGKLTYLPLLLRQTKKHKVLFTKGTATQSMYATMRIVKNIMRFYHRGHRTIIKELTARYAPIHQRMNQTATPGQRARYVHKFAALDQHKLDHSSKIAFMYSVVNAGLWDVYSNIRVLGVDHNTTRQSISDHSMIEHRIPSSRSHEHKRAHMLHWADRLFNKQLDELTPSEMNVVNMNYKQQMAKWKASFNNTCGHLGLLTKVMRRVDSIGTSRFPTGEWKRLVEICPMKDKHNVNTCTSCGYAVLCPHHYSMFNSSGSQSSMRNALIQYVDESVSNHLSYFCRICGELLIKNVESTTSFNRKDYSGTPTFDPTEQKVYINVKSTVMNHVRVSKNANVNSIIQTITKMVTPHINTEESRLTRIKTQSQDTVSMMLYVFISVFTYAALIKMMSHNPDIMSFNIPAYLRKSKRKSGGGLVVANNGSGGNGSDVGDTPRNQQSRRVVKHEQKRQIQKPTIKVGVKQLQGMFKVAISLILISKKTTMNKTTRMSDMDIKNLLITAYRRLTVVRTKHIVLHMPKKVEYIMDLVFYKYMRKMSPHKDIRALLGVKTPQDAINMKNPFGNITITKPPWLKHKLTDMEKYAWESYESTMMWLKSNYMLPMKDQLHDDRKRAATYRELEERLFMKYHVARRMPVAMYVVDKQYYKYRKPHIHMVHCRSGLRHVFDTFVYSPAGGAGQLVEIKKKEFGSWIKNPKLNNKYVNMKMVDKRCSSCGELGSHVIKSTHGKDSDKLEREIQKVVHRNMNIVSFYNYYQSRCPMAVRHEWNGDVCGKCKLSRDNITKRSSAHYDKYIKRFESRDKTDHVAEFVARLGGLSSGVKQWVGVVNTVAPSVALDVSPANIIALANICEIDRRLIINLGMSADVFYKKLKAGKVNPVTTSTKGQFASGIKRMRQYITASQTHYRRLLNRGNVKIVGEMKQVANEFREANKLPKMRYPSATYAKSYDVVSKTMHADMVSAWCSMLVDLVRRVGKIDNQAMIQFVKYTVGVVFESERAMSKPNKFTRSAVRRGNNAVTERNTEGVKIVTLDDTIGKQADPFSLDDVDVDEADIWHDN